jgi:hypothetical protein
MCKGRGKIAVRAGINMQSLSEHPTKKPGIRIAKKRYPLIVPELRISITSNSQNKQFQPTIKLQY